MSSFGAFKRLTDKSTVSILMNIREVCLHLVSDPGEVRIDRFWVDERGLVRDV